MKESPEFGVSRNPAAVLQDNLAKQIGKLWIGNFHKVVHICILGSLVYHPPKNLVKG